MLLLVLGTRCFLQILIITHTNRDMGHFFRVDVFSSGLRMTDDLWPLRLTLKAVLKLQLHDAIYRLRFYSNSLIHILSLSNLHNNLASIQKNRNDKLHRVIVALRLNFC